MESNIELLKAAFNRRPELTSKIFIEFGHSEDGIPYIIEASIKRDPTRMPMPPIKKIKK